MRTTKVLSVTMPEDMLKRARKRAKKENRTMSELVREALRHYEGSQWLREMQAYGEERSRTAGVLTEQDAVRVVHGYRAENRAEAERGSRKAS
jgi:metal-responsive CopG/Arc/MetJ family transcriptional regulator